MAYTRQTKSSKAYSSHHGRVHNEWVPTRASQLRYASSGGAPINSVSVGHVVVGSSRKINHSETYAAETERKKISYDKM